ncbi:MAG: ribosome silencing factor [Candidatus Omnitrophota bacterium]
MAKSSIDVSGADSKDKALTIGNFALEKKAENVVILDMQEVSSFCNYFVITGASSFKHTRAIAEHIEESLSKYKVEPHHIEGKEGGQWILLDYGDVVAHIFCEETRKFYDLERLWGDAKQLKLNS